MMHKQNPFGLLACSQFWHLQLELAAEGYCTWELPREAAVGLLIDGTRNGVRKLARDGILTEFEQEHAQKALNGRVVFPCPNAEGGERKALFFLKLETVAQRVGRSPGLYF